MSRRVEAEVSWRLHSVTTCFFMCHMPHKHVKSLPLGVLFSIIMKKAHTDVLSLTTHVELRGKDSQLL